MATVSVVFRKDKLNKSGEAPIHFIIIKDRKKTTMSSGVMLHQEDWDSTKNRVKSKHKNSARLNSMLSTKFSELQDEVLELETYNKSLTSRQLRDKVYGKKPTDFFTYADEVVAVYLRNKKIGTYDKNKAIINKLRLYMKGASIAFQDITVDFLKKYEIELRDVHNNCTNTVARDFKFIRKIFNDAYADDLIEHHINPFHKFKIQTEKTQRQYLTEDELILIENAEIKPGIKKSRHRDVFIFASYTGGLRISDILLLQWKHFDGTHINFTIMKTGTQLSIKVPNKGLELINKYKPTEPNKNAFIFGLLRENLDIKDPIALDLAISSATSYLNTNLKAIAAQIGLEKPISSHIARHTFGTRALRKGIRVEKLQQLMGHAQIRETMIYAKIVSTELDEAMDVFND